MPAHPHSDDPKRSSNPLSAAPLSSGSEFSQGLNSVERSSTPLSGGSERSPGSVSADQRSAESLSVDQRSGDSLSAELARFVGGLHGRIAPAQIAAACTCVIDTLGAIAYGAEQPWSQAAARYVLATGGGDGGCTVVGRPDTASPPMAAFANGAAAHAFEIDDCHEEAVGHPGSVIVPAALAVAEQFDASGLEFLEAVVIGYEVMSRAGIAVGPVSHMLSGFHPTSMSGVFGAAATAAHLRGLDAEGINHALGIAASLASGTTEFAASGGMAKRIHAARAAEGGVLAAALAADGFEGARDGLAGKYGFCRIFTDDPQPQRLTERLGERWMIDEVTLKPYPSCSDVHPMVQATSEIVAAHHIAAGDIERIVVHGTTKTVELNDFDGTGSVMAAQYSAPFNVALAVLADPADPAAFAPERIRDPALAALQAKVAAIVATPEFDATYAWKQGARVQITLTGGTVLERTVHGQKGSIYDPLSDEEVERKFRRFAAGRLDDGIPALIRSLPDAGSLSGLTQSLRQA